MNFVGYGLMLCLSAAIAQAQTLPAPTPAQLPQLEGVTLGQPMTQVRSLIGDPLHAVSTNGAQIWRYLGPGGAVFVDVLVKNNVAYSVTVVRRFAESAYTDSHGISFGMTGAAVRAKLGNPGHVSTNADDSSVDFWYVAGSTARIYEFYGDQLGFVQIVVSPTMQASFAPGPPVAPGDGTSIARAVMIRPSNPLSNAAWIDAYLTANACGKGGHWLEGTNGFIADAAAHDPAAYTLVQARCSDGAARRAFYFDTRDDVKK